MQESFHHISQDLIQLLKKHWGFDTLRSHQIGPVADLYHGNCTLALLPTGGGKSICFQLPALARGGVCLVVTPLIALMEDQCEGLRKRGVRAEAWIGNNGDRVLDNVRFGATQFLYLSPERIHDPMFVARCEHWNVTTIVIDEAHCISQWGHDFRPAFQSIFHMKRRFPDAVWGAYTATATPEVLADIAKQLPEVPKIHRAGMRRPNLTYEVATWGDRDANLLHDVIQSEGKGLVYVQSRHESEKWAQRMSSVGIQSASFHAGLPSREKQTRQAKWMKGDLQVLACTSAFGMGIDAPDVRWVFHASAPQNLESYVQEAGRAGRDGKASRCVLYAKAHDFDSWRERIERQFPPDSVVREAYQWAANQSHAAIGDLPDSTIQIKEPKHIPALRMLASQGYFHLDCREHRFNNDLGSITFLASDRHRTLSPPLNGILSWIERQSSEQLHHVNAASITTMSNSLDTVEKVDVENAILAFEKLDALGHIDWKVESPEILLTWAVPRMSTSNVTVDRSRQALLLRKVDQFSEYAIPLKGRCRAAELGATFGDVDDTSCGSCDRCLSKTAMLKVQLEDRLNAGDVHVQDTLMSFSPGHRQHARDILAQWYRSGEIVASEQHIRWTKPKPKA